MPLLCRLGVTDVWSIDEVPMCPVEGSMTMLSMMSMIRFVFIHWVYIILKPLNAAPVGCVRS